MTISDLEVKIGADLAELRADLRKMDGMLNQQAKRADSSFKGAFANIGGYIAGAFAGVAISNFGRHVIEVTASFQKYEAVLTNTLGSQEAAAEQMQMIQQFASKTPFSVNELTDSFVRLTNQGLMPSEDALRRYGDLAASTGKQFDQLAEAVIDATVGEFERLKEFGIKASSEGDKVAFTFKGVTTEVAKTSEAIETYILSLGDAEGVSGAMAAISQTLGGQISNLGDSYDQLGIAVGEMTNGPGMAFISFLKNGIEGVTKLVDNINKIDDGTLEAMNKAGESMTWILESTEQAEGLQQAIERGNLEMERSFSRMEGLSGNALKIAEAEYAAAKTFTSDRIRLQEALITLKQKGIDVDKMGIDTLAEATAKLKQMEDAANNVVTPLQAMINEWAKGVPAIDHAADAAELFKKHIYEGLTAMERFKFEEFEKMREDAALLGQLVPTGAGQRAIGMEAEEGMFLDAQGREFGTEGEAQTQAMIDQFEQLRLQSFLSREDIMLTGMATDAFAASFGDAMEGALLNGENFVESLGQNLRQLIVNMARAVAQALILKAVLSTIPGIGQIAGIGSVISGGLNFSSAIRGSDIITVSQRASSNQSRGGN